MNARNLLTGMFLVVATVQGAIALSMSGSSSVTVLAHGPAGLRIEGKSSAISLEEDASGMTFNVPLEPIDTGIDLRNRHLREMLQVEKFPAATLRVSRSELKFPREREPAEGNARGELTLHGQSRPVEVHYHADRSSSGTTKVHGSLQLDLRDFAITRPSYLGVSVAPEVQVDVDLIVEGT
jgi:polyisoprenoid-binding protein YceI